MPYLVRIKPAQDGIHKFTALFKLDSGKFRSVYFGARGYPDMTQPPHDEERMKKYLKRHAKREDWNDPMSPGALSRWILWSAPTMKQGVKNYHDHFKTGDLVGGSKDKAKDEEEDDEIREYPLSDADIRKLLPGLKIISYPDLNDVQRIEEVFDDEGRCLILYLTEDEYTGHWVCMIRKGRTIEYFDPYGGIRPDGERKWLSKSKLLELDQYHPRLTELLRQSGAKVNTNPYHFQKTRTDIATCGRHCCCRMAHKHMSLASYKRMIDDSGLSPDDFVSAWTYRVLKH